MANRFWVGGTGSWDQSSTTHWSATSGGGGGAAVPLAGDDVFFDDLSGTGTCTITASGPCRSLQSASAGHVSTLKTLVHNGSVTLTIGDGTAGANSIALDLSGFTTYTKGGGATAAITFASTSATQQTINYNSFAVGTQTWSGATGSWKLTSGFTTTIAGCTLTAGSLDLNGQTITTAAFTSSNSNTRSLTLGAANITITGTSNGSWDLSTTTGLTFSGASATIIMSGAGPLTQLFRGAGFSYGTLQITGTGTIGITGANTFVNFTRSNAAACGLTLPSAVTQTVTGTLQISGASGAIMTLAASSNGSAATISCPNLVNCDYLSLKDSTAAGTTPFYAGTHSSIVSGCTNWTLTPPPVPVVLGAVAGVSTTSLALAVPAGLGTLSAAGQSAATLGLAPVLTALTASAVSTGALLVSRPEPLALGTVSAASTAAMSLAPVLGPLTTTGQSTTALTLTIPIVVVPLAPTGGQASTSLNLLQGYLGGLASTASSQATVTITAPATFTLSSVGQASGSLTLFRYLGALGASGSSTAAVTVTVTVLLSLVSDAASSATASISTPTMVPLDPVSVSATTLLDVIAAELVERWRVSTEPRWPVTAELSWAGASNQRWASIKEP